MTRWVAGSLVLLSFACSSSRSDSSDGDGGGAPSETGGSSPGGGTAGKGGTGAGGDAGFAGAEAGFTQRDSTVTGDLEFLATNDNVIVAAGNGQLVYSDDGVTWQAPDPPVAAVGVAFGGGTFVALGEMGVVFTSPDGKSWNESMPYAAASAPTTVTYAFGKFFATGYGTSDIYETSPDGLAWTGNHPMFLEPPRALSAWSNVIWALSAGDWVFMSSNWGVTGHNFGSQDGVTWRVIDDWTSLTTDVVYSGTTYCAGGVYSGGASADGIDWTTTAVGIRGVTYFDGLFVGVGSFGEVRVSRDCITWQEGAEPALPEYLPNSIEAGLEKIRVHKGRLVIVGYGGRIWTSP